MRLLYANENVAIIKQSELHDTAPRDFRELVSKAISVKKARDFIDFVLACPACMFEQSIIPLGPDWALVEHLIRDEEDKPYKGSIINAIDHYFPNIEPLDIVAIKAGALGTYHDNYDPHGIPPAEQGKAFGMEVIAPTKQGLCVVPLYPLEALCANARLLATYAAIACGEKSERAIRKLDLGLPESIQAIDTQFWTSANETDEFNRTDRFIHNLNREIQAKVRTTLRAKGFGANLGQTENTRDLTEHPHSPIRFYPSTWSDVEISADLFVNFIALILSSNDTSVANPSFTVRHDAKGFHVIDTPNPIHEFYRKISHLAEVKGFRFCAYCKNPILVDLSRGNEGIYCSDSCNTQASKARRELAKALAAAGVPVEDAIERIGKDYETSIQRWYADTKALLG